MAYPALIKCLKNGYSFSFLKRDLLSGITVAIVAIPLSIAFAIASGATPTTGLFTAIIGGFIVSAFGGSKFNISGPAGAFIGVIFSIISIHGYSGLLISTFLAGIFLFLMSIFKLGRFIAKIPNVVVIGFSLGLGIDIFSGQIPDFLGFHCQGIPVFIKKWIAYFQHIKDINLSSFIIGTITIISALIVRKKFSKLPAFLIAILISSIITEIFDIKVETIYSRFGYIHIEIPEIQWNILEEVEHPTHLLQYIFPSLTIALLAGIEALLAATIADKMTNTTHNSNIELFGQSIANLSLPLLGCLPVAGTTARTIVNVKSGAKSPIAGMSHSIFILIFVMIFSNLISQINMPTIAGILIIVATDMMSFKKVKNVIKNDTKINITILFLTAILVPTIGIVYSILINTCLFYFNQRYYKNLTIKKNVSL